MKFGDLVVNLGLNANPFTKGLGAARGALGSFGSGLGGVMSGLGTFAGAMTGLAGVGGIAGVGIAVNSSMNKIDEMAKSADKLGISTESFVGLNHAANLAGVEMSNLESQMLKLTKQVSEAANGNQGLADKFAAVGLNVKSLLAMRPDQQFYAVADAMAGVTNQSDKVRVATELFGKSGADLLPLLADGSAGLAAMQSDAEKLGLTFSRIDAAKVEEANDAISRMKSAFGGLADSLAIALAPALTTIVDALTTAVSWSGRLASDIADIFGAGRTTSRQRVKESILYSGPERLDPFGRGGHPLDLPDGGSPFNDMIVSLPAKITAAVSASVHESRGLLKGSREAIDRMVNFRNQNGGLDAGRMTARNTQRTAAGVDRLADAVSDLVRSREALVFGGFN